ncbi:carbamoyltransferase HypF [candidate division GN15 bacterium]|uniref:Carbamoyltransferase n=1 Tax=candidate division GN15 bacterium TaxID=2072418 RepID=A0A855X4F8_9BACT|nr:MAG: carbamoyltransferase HypF [candidate division GN15 bacterium]
MERHRIRVNGIVQGVGFRPFVFRLASRLGLAGSVQNNSVGVTIEVEGARAAIDELSRLLQTELPPLARITELNVEEIPPTGETGFGIITSSRQQIAGTLISPDVAVCDDCLRELFDENDRRYRYPFINCTNCGPRYTIVERIPYDRPFTSMRVFPMCPNCEREYRDPLNRRFHAQPNACPVCGPKLTWHCGDTSVTGEQAITRTIECLKSGQVVAIRGLGGFHLAVDPHIDRAVMTLRERKGRAEKPFALMARDIEAIKRYCVVSPEEEGLLRHYTRPIVLLRKREGADLPDSIAPGQKYLGFMLPYTPLQHLLLRDTFDALIMTSGNYSDEPIAIGNDEAIERMANLADSLLLHDREILQRCDDSIARVAAGQPRVMRRARGYVPEPVILRYGTAKNILAVGGELKNTIGLSRGRTVFLSQHVGDLDNPSALAFFHHAIEHLGRLLEVNPQVIAYDLHPEYLSTKWALDQKYLPVVGVQHHHAHLASVMAENGVRERTIGIILDGTGFGLDGTLWGGEVLVGDYHSFDRFAWLEPVPMPGGAQAIHQPWRMAFSYLHHAYGNEIEHLQLDFLKDIDSSERRILVQMINQRINSPLTSGCGRLFDGVAALLGLKREVSYEAQAAMLLEMAIGSNSRSAGDWHRDIAANRFTGGPIKLSPFIKVVVGDILKREECSTIAARFHRTLVELFVHSAKAAGEATGIATVGLSGGVFQNVYLFELMVKRLKQEGFRVLAHGQVPTNDGGIALGQVVIADALTTGQ